MHQKIPSQYWQYIALNVKYSLPHYNNPKYTKNQIKITSNPMSKQTPSPLSELLSVAQTKFYSEKKQTLNPEETKNFDEILYVMYKIRLGEKLEPADLVKMVKQSRERTLANMNELTKALYELITKTTDRVVKSVIDYLEILGEPPIEPPKSEHDLSSGHTTPYTLKSVMESLGMVTTAIEELGETVIAQMQSLSNDVRGLSGLSNDVRGLSGIVAVQMQNLSNDVRGLSAKVDKMCKSNEDLNKTIIGLINEMKSANKSKAEEAGQKGTDPKQAQVFLTDLRFDILFARILILRNAIVIMRR
eukprot:TRINITY_DN433_c0_g1_i9.p1 TRINITY_DN433_c0_g1~~TRINITY_DN433_c0_g1_i9.p1  ORF type:complete len:314 (-),score=15.47 TRINITY_DN433_c0_g1_i9:39-947(-)